MRILDRELPTCSNCGSSVRFRSLIAALQERLFNAIKPLKQLRERKDLAGLGMSDEELYGTLLEEKFNYTNTFFHTKPYLDISNPPSAFRNRFDFVISAEVMEHVPPPIDIAFKNLRSLLRVSGLLIFSVPFTSERETTEHFPDLHQFKIVGCGNERQLINITRKGEKQVFRNLVFHGGKGATLEMRIFSQAAVLKLLEDSGFREIRIHSKCLPEWGIVHPHPFSVPITALAA
jgi:SAM-dependent methyltransferase